MKLKLLLIGLSLFSALGLFFFSEQESATAEVQCKYRDTQARVQNNINTPWSTNITVGCERSFNVGSFHDGTGQFANDTVLHLTGPGMNQFYSNGNTISVLNNGTYTLEV